MENKEVYKYLKKIKEKNPLIQCITNFVTINDCANIVLAVDASPTMSYFGESATMTAASVDALVCNMGFVEFIDSMLACGKILNKRNRPVVLDPIAAGSNKYNYMSSMKLLDKVKVSLIRGNSSEIKALYHGQTFGSGVDASAKDKIQEDQLMENTKWAKKLAEKYDTVLAISGPIDLIVSKNRAVAIKNGVNTMSRITGSGCMLSALSAAFLGGLDNFNQEEIFQASASASILMSVAGEIAEERRVKERKGNASFSNYLIDTIFNIAENEFELDKEILRRANIKEIL